MATTEQIAELRSLINDTTEPYEYDAPLLSSKIDQAGGDVRKAAGTVWAQRASAYAGLVDVTEGSSSRKNSQLYKQALDMAKYYGEDPAATPETPTTAGRTRTHQIVR